MKKVFKKPTMDTASRSRSLIVFLASGFGSGFFPIAPGTVGTLVAMGLYSFLSRLPSFLFLITSIAFVFLSVWIADRAERRLKEKDPSCVVIDEIAGYFITMTLVPWSWANAWMGFLFFRLFDIVKPFPIRRIDRTVPGGCGIVLDDVLAGVYANIVLQVIMRWL